MRGGGTALHKLALAEAVRYSEDIDLVQVVAGPVRPFFDALREHIDPWLGAHAYEHRAHSVRGCFDLLLGPQASPCPARSDTRAGRPGAPLLVAARSAG